jgi:hypothetical protein
VRNGVDGKELESGGGDRHDDPVPNPNGHPASLLPPPPRNTRAVKHGVYSGRLIAERAAEIRDALMTLPHAQPLDVLAAEEIGSVIAALEAGFGHMLVGEER